MDKLKLTKEQIENLKCIMGKEIYTEISKFYRNTCTTDKFDFKVFLTRRSYILYRIFVSIFSEEDTSFQVHGQIYNSHSVKNLCFLKSEEQNSAEEKDSKVLIIDDIIINGRTVQGIIDELKNNFKLENIKVWCVVGNSEAMWLEKNEHLIGHIRYVTQEEWRKLSDKLTEFIVASNIGYVSFVNPHYVDKEIKTRFEGRLQNVPQYVNRKGAEIIFDQYNVKSTVYFYTFDTNIIEHFKLKTCIRIYETSDSTTIIPYVFLPTLLKDNCYDYCKKLLGCFNLSIPNSLKNPGFEVMLYQWTVYQLSEILYEKFCQSIFGSTFPCLESFKSVNTSTALEDEKIEDLSYRSNDVEECYGFFKNSCPDINETNVDVSTVLDNYLQTMFNKDEQRAFNNEIRYKGIRIQDILEFFREKGLKIDQGFENQCIGTIINSWDTGKSSYVIAEDSTSEGVVISGYIKNGEQAYRILYDLYNFQYRIFYYMFLSAFICDSDTLNTAAEKLEIKFGRSMKFVEFFHKLNFNTYFYDLLAVKPRINDKDKEIYSNVTKYIEENLKGVLLNGN